MILYESDSAILSFDSSIPCLELIIKPGLRNSKEFKKTHKIIIEKFIELKEHHANLCFFIDGRDLFEITKREIEWLEKNFFPRLENAGLTKKAFLFFDSEAGKSVLATYKAKLDGTKIMFKEFKSFQQAKAWLRETENSNFK